MNGLHRIPEPELMTGLEQAQAYADADFSEANQLFVESFKQRFPEFVSGRFVDFGCGPADIPVRLMQQYPNSRVIALDGSQAMLDLASQFIAQSGVQQHIQLQRCLLGHPETVVPLKATADVIISNSLLHHMSDPKDLWRCVKSVGKAGAVVLVMDLARPQTPADAEDLIGLYAVDAPEVLKTDFRNSLYAAYTVEEVEMQLHSCGLSSLETSMVSDRHLMVSGLCPND